MTKEKILKEFDEEYYDEGQFECDVHERQKRFLSQSLDQIRQEGYGEGYEAGEASMIKNSQGFIEKTMLEKDAMDLIRQETLSEVLKMLPEEKELIVDSVNFPTGKITTADMKIGFNFCLSQIKETIEKEMK